MTEESFVETVNKNSKRIFLIALSFTKNREDAEDIMQNSFLKLWSSKEKFENEEHIAKWLTVVATNESKNLLKLYSKKARHTEIDVAEDFMFDSVEDKELFNVVMSLPPKLAVAIHLFYYEDMSIKEIAETLNVSENVIKTRLSRGRKKLMNFLEGEWKDA